jgi:hypothetical protein
MTIPLGQDLSYALRQLRKKPGFTIAALAILALGIVANTTIFTAVYAILIRPLPFKDADRLVFIRKQNPARGWDNNNPPRFLHGGTRAVLSKMLQRSPVTPAYRPVQMPFLYWARNHFADAPS